MSAVLYVCSACRAEVPKEGTTRGDGICLCRPCRTAFYASPEAATARAVLVSMARAWVAKRKPARLQVVPGGES